MKLRQSINCRAQKRPRGRPLKLQSSKSASHTSHSSTSALPVSKVRTMKNIKSKRKMSQLEKLPTELLETIFLHCLNLNMPACSPVIGGKLSSEFIYSKIIIHAFGPIWNDWYGKLIDPDRQGATGDHALQVGLNSMAALVLADDINLVCDLKISLGKVASTS